MITKLFALGAISLATNSNTEIATLDRSIKITFDPVFFEKNSQIVTQIESIISNTNYVGFNIEFTQQNLCNPNELFITEIENETLEPNVAIVTTLNSELDPTLGGLVRMSVDNIDFSSSINEPKPEFTSGQVLLNSFWGESSNDYDSGYSTVCDEKITQCVTYVR